MNGFSDVHVSFAPGPASIRTRLGNRWSTVAAPPPGVWIGTANGEAGASLLHTAAAPGWRLWAVGDLHAYRGEPTDVAGRLVADLARGCAEPDLLRAHAVVFAWEDAPRRLHVLVDRMGTVHAYAGGAPGRRSVGTCFATVAEGSTQRPDWVGLTGFCGFGFYPGDRTPWTDVAILRPATWTVFDEHGDVVSSRRTWDWWFDPDPVRGDDDLLDEFHEIWSRTVRSQIGERRVVVPLSGGLDSRTVFAAAVPAGVGGVGGDPARVRTLTYGYAPDSAEIGISQRVARARGHRATDLVVEPYLFDRLPEVVGAVEGFQSLCFSRQAGVSEVLANLGEAVVGGHWGDVWFDTAGAFAPGGGPVPGDPVERAHAKFAKRGRGWLLEHLCAPNLDGADPEAVLRDLLRDELARLPDLGDPDLSLKALKTEQWSFRWTLASVRAYQLALPTVLPFYADDVVDFFLRVPTDRLPGRRLQTAYLRRHHPDLARITRQDTGMSLFERPWEPSVALLRRVAAKGVRSLRRRTVIERNWEVQYGSPESRARLTGLVVGAPGPLLAAGTGALPGLLDRFARQPDPATGYTVDVVATLAAIGHPPTVRLP